MGLLSHRTGVGRCCLVIGGLTSSDAEMPWVGRHARDAGRCGDDSQMSVYISPPALLFGTVSREFPRDAISHHCLLNHTPVTYRIDIFTDTIV